jgi:hypothetical protein
MLLNGFIHLEASFVEFCQVSIFVNVGVELFSRSINRHYLKDEVWTENLHKKDIEFYEKYQDEHEEILLKRISLIHKTMKAFIYIYFCVCFGPVITCWILFFATGKYVTMVPFSYSWTSLETLSGFLLNMVVSTVISAGVILMILIISYFIPFYGSQVVPMTDIFAAKIKNHGDNLINENEELIKMHRPNSQMSFRKKLKLEALRTIILN